MHIPSCVINDFLNYFFSKSVAAAYRRPAPAPPAIAAPLGQYQQEYQPQYRTQYQRQYQPAAAAPQYRPQYNPNKYPGLGSYSVNYRRWKGEWRSIFALFILFWVLPLFYYTLDERLLFVHRLRSLIYAFAHTSSLCRSIKKLLNNRLLDFQLFVNQTFLEIKISFIFSYNFYN